MRMKKPEQIGTFRSVLDAIWTDSSDALCELSLTPKILHRNPRFEILFGNRELKEIFGNNFSCLHTALRKCLKKNESAEWRMTLQDSSQNERFFNFKLVPTSNPSAEGGKTALLIVQTPELYTTHKQNKIGKHSVDLISMVASHLPVVLFAIDENGVITLFEGPSLIKQKIKPSEVVGQSVYQRYHDRPDILSDIDWVLQNRKPRSSIFSLEDRTFNVRLSPFYEENKFKGMVGVAMDITDRTTAETNRNAIKDRVLKMTAHDIRGSLAGVMSFLNDIVDGGLLKNLNPNQLHIFKMMQSNCQQVYSLTNEIVQAHNLEHQEFRLSIRNIRVVEFFLDLFERSKAISAEKSVPLRIRIQEVPQEYPLDPALIERAVTNLIRNAVEHSSMGSAVELKISTTDGQLLISVKDYGEGIDEDQIPYLFDEFKAFSGSQTRSDRLSRGLGLYIVRRIVDLHEGNIWLESKKGAGSEFFFSLPLPDTHSQVE